MAGFGVTKVRPEAASTHSPSMKSLRSVAMKSSTRLSSAIAIMLPFLGHLRDRAQSSGPSWPAALDS